VRTKRLIRIAFRRTMGKLNHYYKSAKNKRRNGVESNENERKIHEAKFNPQSRNLFHKFGL